MLDVRQGPLLIENDPLATLAERCTVARPMRPAELEAFLEAAGNYRGPHLVAYRGYVNTWSDARAYYLDDAGVYRDTLTDEEWQCRSN